MPKRERKDWTQLSESARRAAALKERKQLATDTAKLAEHNRAIEASGQAVETRRVSGVKIARRKPFDPEDGRYRAARRVPGTRYVHLGLPTDSPHECPSCGAGQPSYLMGGRYRCDVNRLVTKNYGCGHRWIGPHNPSESPLEASAAAQWADMTIDATLADAAIPESLTDVVFT